MNEASPTTPREIDVAVLGGGISGLTVAAELSSRGRSVAVFDSSSEPGGAMRTLRTDGGYVFELGPSTILARGEEFDRVSERAGVEGDLIEASRAASKRFVVHRGRLVPLPRGPIGFLRTPLFSLRAKLRLLREPWIEPAAPDAEESIADFVRRRLGAELLDYAVGPFVSGVYAGDPEMLSVVHATAKIHALERQHGSLIRGAFKKRRGPAPAGRLVSFREGLATLPRALAAKLGDGWRPSTRVERVDRVEGVEGFESGTVAYRIATDRGEWRARSVVSAFPARAASEALRPLDAARVDRALGGLPTADIAVVSLGFRREDIEHRLDGFGFLAPAVERRFVLGCLFSSCLFPGRAPEGRVALSVFLGGARHPGRVAIDDAPLLEEVRKDVGPLLGLRAAPEFSRITRWQPAIPQYVVGHGARKEAAAELEAEHPGVFIGGNALHGVSVPDCIRGGLAIAERADTYLRASSLAGRAP